MSRASWTSPDSTMAAADSAAFAARAAAMLRGKQPEERLKLPGRRTSADP
jgi:hypothetical protein